MTFLEAKTALARKLNITYSDIANNGLWTDSDLGYYVQAGLTRAWDFKPWPFKQDPQTATTIANTDYYDYPQNIMLGSIYLLIVGGKEFKKLNMEDYLRYFQLYPGDNAPYWTENGLYIFINKNAYVQGVDIFDVYGNALAPTLSNPTDILPFSPVTDNQEYSGNEAIVQLAYSEALDSEKKNNPQAAEVERKKAYDTLGILWKPFADSKANLQAQRSLFQTPNYFPANGSSAGKHSPTGNFNL